MAGKKEVQKTVAFRLNIAKEEERELYYAIMRHGRGRENDVYGSSGAYVKAALRHYHKQESELELQEQNRQEMQSYLKELAEKQGEVFLDKLVELIHHSRPDAVIATHPLCAQLVSRLKGEWGLDLPLLTCVTDVTSHPEWINQNTDCYLVPSRQVLEDLAANMAAVLEAAGGR